jgi:alpha-glucosidase (family GH31 glycosyl hydrolase)
LTDDYYVNLVTWIMPGTFTGTPPPGAFTSVPNQYLDLTDSTEVNWYRNKIKTGQYAFGVKGHKLDRIDNGWVSKADLPAFSDGTPAPERHKKYAYLNCKVSDNMLRTDAGLGDDAFLFPRCAVGGCQQYISAIWNGDTYADWAGLTTSVGNAIRAGFLGFPMWGSDICGYSQKSMPSIENYCRCLLFGVYSGFMEFMLDGKEPWNLSAANETLVQNIYNQRFTLLPYIYSIINTSADDGVTMMPLVGAYPDDPKTYAISNEYLFGPSMLVAPLMSAVASRALYLPAGKWFNVYNYADERIGGDSITTSAMSLTQLPVYIKSNSIYPTGQIYAGLAKKWDPTFDAKRNLVINAFPGLAGESNSFTYVDYLDSNKHKELNVSASADYIVSITAPAMTISGTVVVCLHNAPISVATDTGTITNPQYDAVTKKLTVSFDANKAINVTIHGIPAGILRTSELIRTYGRMSVRNTLRGTQLTIPRIAGINQNTPSVINVFDAAGRTIIKRDIALKQSAPTSIVLTLVQGVYFAKLEVKGVNAGTIKIVAP